MEKEVVSFYQAHRIDDIHTFSKGPLGHLYICMWSRIILGQFSLCGFNKVLDKVCLKIILVHHLLQESRTADLQEIMTNQCLVACFKCICDCIK